MSASLIRQRMEERERGSREKAPSGPSRPARREETAEVESRIRQALYTRLDPSSFRTTRNCGGLSRP